MACWTVTITIRSGSCVMTSLKVEVERKRLIRSLRRWNTLYTHPIFFHWSWKSRTIEWKICYRTLSGGSRKEIEQKRTGQPMIPWILKQEIIWWLAHKESVVFSPTEENCTNTIKWRFPMPFSVGALDGFRQKIIPHVPSLILWEGGMQGRRPIYCNSTSHWPSL